MTLLFGIGLNLVLVSCRILPLLNKRGVYLTCNQSRNKKSPMQYIGLFYNLVSQPISRVLSWIIIRLGLKSLLGSSNLPGSDVGHTIRNPIWSCSGWSLPCNQLLPVARCALTAPFHPYQSEDWRSPLCCTCRRLAPPSR